MIGIVSTLRIPLQAVEESIGAHQLKVISYYSPGMAIFFLLFTISYTARSFFVDRSQGMIERMRTAPVRPAEILLGKAISVFVYGVVSLATIGVVTTDSFGADWGAPLPAALLGLSLVFSVVCLTALVIGLARSQRQAEGIASIIIFGLALLGGDFFFISSAPSTIKHLALLTPTGGRFVASPIWQPSEEGSAPSPSRSWPFSSSVWLSGSSRSVSPAGR